LIFPPTLTHGPVAADSAQSKAGRNRIALLLVLLAAAAGLVAAIAAASASGPFAGLRPRAHPSGQTHLVRNVMPTAEINASALFPTPAPPATVQKVVNVYDLPAPAPAPARAAETSGTSDKSESDHSRSGPAPTPSGQPENDHGGAGKPPAGTPPGGTPPGGD
jgi:hypothetical protein